jgi:uncharacterized protein (DUF4415 family)
MLGKGNGMKRKKHKADKGHGVIEYEDGTYIVLDEDDVPELTTEWFKNARPVRELHPELAAHSVVRKAKAGRPKVANPKKVQSFKLSPDLIEAIVTSGKGYNTRVEAALRDAVEAGRI